MYRFRALQGLVVAGMLTMVGFGLHASRDVGEAELLNSARFRVPVGGHPMVVNNLNACTRPANDPLFGGRQCQQGQKQINIPVMIQGVMVQVPVNIPDGCPQNAQNNISVGNCAPRVDYASQNGNGLWVLQPNQLCPIFEVRTCSTGAAAPLNGWLNQNQGVIPAQFAASIAAIINAAAGIVYQPCLPDQLASQGYCPNGAVNQAMAEKYSSRRLTASACIADP